MFQSAVYNQLMILINGYLYAYTYANSISIAFTISKHDTHVVNKHLFIHVFSIMFYHMHPQFLEQLTQFQLAVPQVL